MKDEHGLYYYPFPQNRRVHMYVREAEGIIWFRLWSADDPDLWEKHGWVPYGAIKQAAAMYKGDKFLPNRAYDIEVAKMLVKENASDSEDVPT
ncbi:MAG: hypothetical protein KAV83_11115 [Desulfobacterales bacterium]|nr:hypothetical protein [Desulfobacterales bacterium]